MIPLRVLARPGLVRPSNEAAFVRDPRSKPLNLRLSSLVDLPRAKGQVYVESVVPERVRLRSGSVAAISLEQVSADTVVVISLRKASESPKFRSLV